ncbi:uncharacterized protein SCHCODRAFT_01105264 [Schizophyllum commune H4-8]|nr:uncharacterized protein SCHCODRAFT_01105264 [Schizophyllum commune H4-8]KAI5886802.1 hypothetical protein SCHCODRAFT_01105264 [Schizophyllum commune H4-8]
MRDPESPWRCSHEGCPDPAYPNKKAECRTYKTKREVHRQKYHCTQVTVVYNGERITVFRDTKTSLFFCPCGSFKHARRHSRRLQTLCAREEHPAPHAIGPSPDSDEDEEDEEDIDNSEYTMGSDEDDRSRSASISVISVHDSPKARQPARKPLRAAPASRLRQANHQLLPLSPQCSSVTTLVSSAGPRAPPTEAPTPTEMSHVGLQRPRIGRPPAHLIRALATASASVSSPEHTATLGTQTPGKRKRSSSLPRTTRAKRHQRDSESSDSEEGLKIEIEKLKRKIRKQKLRGELHDLARKLKDLEHETDDIWDTSLHDIMQASRTGIINSEVRVLGRLMGVFTAGILSISQPGCFRPGCPNPLHPDKKDGFTNYRAKREEHCQRYHSVHVTVDYQGDRITVFRDLETGFFYCPCGAPKHARRHSRRLRSLCARIHHPSPDDLGPSPDSDGEDDVDEDDEAIDDHSATVDDEDYQSTADNSVISVSDGLESSPPLRPSPASHMRRSNGQFAPRNSGSASTSNTRASASNATVSSAAYVGAQRPRIGRPPAHLLRARAAAAANTQKPKSTASSSSQMPRKRKRTSYESPAMNTRAGWKKRLSSDSEEDLKRQVDEAEKQLRKHKLRKELRDLNGKLEDLKRESGGL